MKKKKKLFGKKEPEIKRGYTVVGSDGKRVYLSSHPDGVSEAEAKHLSEGLACESSVAPIDQVG